MSLFASMYRYRSWIPRVQARGFCQRMKAGETDRQSTSSQHDIRIQLLNAALRFVPAKGWTAEAVMLGANDLKYPEVLHGLFADPGASLVHHFIRTSNSRLVELMKQENAPLLQDSNASFALFVSNALKQRLEMNIPYMERMAEALSIATRPDQLPESLRLLLTMCDDIAFYAGDRATDFSWYTKRSSLAAVYAATELYMLQDKSANYEDTWQFMFRRFNDLRMIAQSSKRVASIPLAIADVAYSFYVVGRNSIGANTQSRNWRP